MEENRKPMRRVAELATVGAEIYRLGVGYDHQHAWRGVLETSFVSFAAMITEVAAKEKLTVGRALAWAITRDLGPMAEFGEVALHQRRAAAYEADCASWKAQSDAVKNGRWQLKSPSRGQRMLMIRMSHILDVPLPGNVSRGQAAEWIARHGGNPSYSKDF
jgi:hypothetical protein